MNHCLNDINQARQTLIESIWLWYTMVCCRSQPCCPESMGLGVSHTTWGSHIALDILDRMPNEPITSSDHSVEGDCKLKYEFEWCTTKKRDIVDTFSHASRAPCHNRYKQSDFPTSWRKAERTILKDDQWRPVLFRLVDIELMHLLLRLDVERLDGGGLLRPRLWSSRSVLYCKLGCMEVWKGGFRLQ